MFKELFALTERAPVLVLLAREGDDKLRVNITRKQDDDEKEVPLSLSILATPAELDAELPLALAEGFALNDESAKKPVSIADQVKGQVDAAATEETKPAARKAPARKKAAKPAAKKPVTPRVVKKREPKKVKARMPAAAPKMNRSDSAKRAALVPSAALAAVIGPEPLRYNDAMSKVWAYIKANNLQDPKNKRKITADAKLQAIAGDKKLAVENLGKYVKANLGSAPATAAVPTPAITPLLPPEKLEKLAEPSPPISEQAAAPPITPAIDLPVAQVKVVIDAPAEASKPANDLDLFS